jgi:hypothetical protein
MSMIDAARRPAGPPAPPAAECTHGRRMDTPKFLHVEADGQTHAPSEPPPASTWKIYDLASPRHDRGIGTWLESVVIGGPAISAIVNSSILQHAAS